MPIYEIDVTVIMSTDVTLKIEAETAEEALEIIERNQRNSDFLLKDGDFGSVSEIEIHTELCGGCGEHFVDDTGFCPECGSDPQGFFRENDEPDDDQDPIGDDCPDRDEYPLKSYTEWLTELDLTNLSDEDGKSWMD